MDDEEHLLFEAFADRTTVDSQELWLPEFPSVAGLP
jgi:hypothetical protein